MQANKNLFKDDELIIVMGVIQQDRFSGGANRLKVNQVWDLPSARCRFGKHLLLSLMNTTPDFERLMREFPQQKIQTDQGEVRRGMSVRIALQRKAPIGNVNAQLQLGDDARFYPSDAALASWTALAGLGKAQIVYD